MTVAYRNWQLLDGVQDIHATIQGLVEQYDSSYELFKLFLSDWTVGNGMVGLQVNGDTTLGHYKNDVSDVNWIKFTPSPAPANVYGLTVDLDIFAPNQDGTTGANVFYFNGTAFYADRDPTTSMPGLTITSFAIRGIYSATAPISFNPFFQVYASNGPVQRGRAYFYGLSTRGAANTIP